MRPFLLLTMSFYVASLSSFALAATPTEKWEGYRFVHSPEFRALNLPFQEFAENSIFKIFTVGMTNLPGESIEIVDMDTDPRVKEIVTDKKTLAKTSDPFHLQIETCRKQLDVLKRHRCPLFKKTFQGTIFFNNGKFYTARHLFHNWLALAAKENDTTVDKLSPPMVLTIPKKENPDKNIGYYVSSFKEDELMKFSAINADPRLNFQHHDRNPITQQTDLLYKNDFVELELQNSTRFQDYQLPMNANGLASIDINKELYAIGFPAADSNSGAPGGKLMGSNGFVTSHLASDAAIQTTYYGSGGMSGSPVISTDGVIEGVHRSGISYGNRIDLKISIFLVLNKEIMADHWQLLDYSFLENQQATLVNQ